VKLDVSEAATTWGTAPDALADVDVDEELVVELLHPEAATTSPNESNAPVNATDLRADPIDLPSIGDSPP
jgi:hypothetical protein